MVVGDPHQSIYGVPRAPRCAASSSSRAEFPRADGTPAPRRRAAHDPPVRSAAAASPPSGSPAASALPGAIDAEAREAFLVARSPATGGSATGGSRCAPTTPSAPRPSTSPTCSAAPTSRTASRGTEMAVLVRSGRTTIPPLRRALGAAGRAGRGGQRRAAARRRTRPCCRCSTRCAPWSTSTTTTRDSADHVDHGPGRGAAARAARRPRRRRRTPARAAAAHPREGPRPRRGPAAADLARAGPPGRARRRLPRRASPAPRSTAARALRTLLRSTRRARSTRAPPPRTCCGTLWSGTDWPGRLRRAVELRRRSAPGVPTATSTRSCALFDVGRPRGRGARRDHGRASATSSSRLVAQQIPADTLAERGVRGAAVRLLTAHRVQGPGVATSSSSPTSSRTAGPTSAGARRCSQADRIGRGELVPPLTAARAAAGGAPAVLRRLHPRPARGWWSPPSPRAEDDGEQPSRFLAELGRRPSSRSRAGPPRPLSLAGLVSELRRTVADPGTSEPLRAAAARRLARLAGETVGDRPLVPAGRPVVVVGHPRREPLGAAGPRPRPAGAGLGQRCSSRSLACPTQWFLTREAGGVGRGPPVRQHRPARARARRAGRRAAS